MTDGHLGPYRLLRKLSQGGMGVVYECVHEAIERRVAVKVLNADYTRNAEAVTRFFNEARAVNRIDHPGLVQIFDHGQLPDGTAYIVMEFLKGETMGKRVRRRDVLSLHQLLRLIRQVAETLAAAHEKGIVHRDLKLDNIMVVPDPAIPGGERTKLLDFGIAKLREPGLRLAETRGDLLLGTPGYMSPEQCRGAAGVDEKSDVYSLGVVMFRLLAGRMPFIAAGAGEIMAMHIYEEPPPLIGLAPWVPEPLATLVHRLLSKDKTHRPTMLDVVALLDSLLQTLPDLQPPPRPPAAASEEHASLTPSMELDTGVDSPSVMPTVDSADDRAPAGIDDLLPLSAPSTLAVSVGQQRTPAPQPRRRPLWHWVALASAPLFLGITLWLVRPAARQPQRGGPALATGSDTTDQPPSSTPGPGTSPTATTARRIHWSVVTEPAGATVVRVSDGSVVGQTPWYAEVVPGSGVEEIRIRMSGYIELLVQLDRSRDVQRHDVLEAVPSAAVVAPPAIPTPVEVKPNPPTGKPRREGARKKPRSVAIELED